MAPHPRGNDPTLTIFDGWRDLNPPKVYTKYENNPFKIVVCSLRKPNSFRRRGGDGGQDQNQSIPDFVRGYNNNLYIFVYFKHTNLFWVCNHKKCYKATAYNCSNN
jgi:hypothetical protein